MRNQIEPRDRTADQDYDESPEPKPVLNVDIINAAYDTLKRSYESRRIAALGRAELEAGTYNLVEGTKQVRVNEINSQCELDVAKAEVDRLTAIQAFFNMASLNNLSETME